MRAALLAALAAASAASGASASGLFPSGAFSDAAAGTTGAAFLKLPGSARAEALAGTYGAAADGAESLFWNPAGLVRVAGTGRSEASVSYNALLASSYGGTLAYARPLADGRSAFAAGLLYHSAGAVDGYDRFGNPNASFTPTDLAGAGGYARRVGPVAVGAGAKFLRSELSGSSGVSFALDLGVLMERVTDVSDGAVDFGASVRNLGPGMSLGGSADPLPFVFQLGGAWHVSPQAAFMLDGRLPVDADPFPSIGFEFLQPFGTASKGALRAGYDVHRTKGLDGLVGLAAGGGLDLDFFRLDYAWVPFGDLGTTHRVTLAFRF